VTKIVDQEQINAQESSVLFSGNVDSQSFKPTVSTIDAVDLFINVMNPQYLPGNITVSILDSNYNLLGYNVTEITQSFSGWMQFHFAPGISVIPGQTYYINLTCDTDALIGWMCVVSSTDYYPDGEGYPHQGTYMDYAFKTEYYGRYVTSQTPIYLNITDNGTEPCIVGSLHVRVGIWYDGEWNYTWHNQSNSPVNLTIYLHEECVHYLNITAWDDLGNVIYDNETFYVDNTPPDINKTIGEPKYHGNGEETIILEEYFEGTFPPAGWYTQGMDMWKRNDSYSMPNYAGGYGYCADAFSLHGQQHDELVTPSFNLSGYKSATLSFISSCRCSSGSFTNVYVSTNGGATWTTLLSWTTDHDPYGPGELVTIDLTPYVGNNSVVIKWEYSADSGGGWYEIDNVTITGAREGSGCLQCNNRSKDSSLHN